MLRANETLGQRITRLRLAAGWKLQKDFAKAIGIDPSALNQLERDKRPPRLETVDKMAHVLSVSRDLILDGDRARDGKPDAVPRPRPSPPTNRAPRTQTNAAEAPRPQAHARTTEPKKPKRTDGSRPDVELADIRAAVRAETTAILYDLAQALLNTITTRRETNIHGEIGVSRPDQAASAANRRRGSR